MILLFLITNIKQKIKKIKFKFSRNTYTNNLFKLNKTVFFFINFNSKCTGKTELYDQDTHVIEKNNIRLKG